MSVTFTKLFSSITASTIWCEDNETRLVWITMLAMADRRGRIFASVPGLAHMARVSTEGCRAAIEKFLGPDPDSRTPDYDGRRIEVIDGGWRLLNYEKYRAVRDEESIKESKRRYINERRAAERGESKDVENVEQSRPQSIQAEAEAEAEADQQQDQKPPASKSPRKSKRQRAMDHQLPAWIDRTRWQAWIAERTKPGAGLGLNIEKLTQWRSEGHDPNEILREAAASGWQGLFLPSSMKTNGATHGTPHPGSGKPSLVERVAANARRIIAAEQSALGLGDGHPVAADGADLRPPLDGTARRVS